MLELNELENSGTLQHVECQMCHFDICCDATHHNKCQSYTSDIRRVDEMQRGNLQVSKNLVLHNKKFKL